MMNPESLDDFEYEIRKVRIAIRANYSGPTDLCPHAEHSLELALASLDAAQAHIDIAKLHQAQALAGNR